MPPDAASLFDPARALELAAAVIVVAMMILEARRAWRNEQTRMARGGVEVPHDVYAVMRFAYPAAFGLMFVEGLARPGAPSYAGFGVLIAAKTLKWWAILTLGPAWTFKVIVMPGTPLVRRGPYRFLRHPNYVAVAMELIGIALVTKATWSAAIAIVGFGALLWRRIVIENRALAPAARASANARTRELGVGPQRQ